VRLMRRLGGVQNMASQLQPAPAERSRNVDDGMMAVVALPLLIIFLVAAALWYAVAWVLRIQFD
jgi:hypothetical protein